MCRANQTYVLFVFLSKQIPTAHTEASVKLWRSYLLGHGVDQPNIQVLFSPDAYRESECVKINSSCEALNSFSTQHRV